MKRREKRRFKKPVQHRHTGETRMRNRRKKNDPFRTMQGRLFLTMLIASLCIACAATACHFLLLRSGNPMREYPEQLFTAADRFSEDLTDRLDRAGLSTLLLKEQAERTADSHLADQNLSLSGLAGNSEAVTALENALYPHLLDLAKEAESSGAFLILNTSSKGSGSLSSSKSVLYLRRNRDENGDVTISLFRGEAGIADLQQVEQQENWQAECDTLDLPFAFSAGRLKSDGICLFPMERLPGTTERGLLIAAPLYLKDGTFLGVCGFELSESTFMMTESPSLSASGDGLTLLACLGTSDAPDLCRCFVQNTDSAIFLSGTLSLSDPGNGLYRCEGGNTSFIGVSKSLTLSESAEAVTLHVLLDEKIYEAACTRYLLQNVLCLLSLLLLSILLSFFLSRRYVKPIRQSIDAYRAGNRRISSVQEIDDLFSFLDEKEKMHAIERNRLLSDRRAEVDPEQYQLFLDGLKTLTPTEREIFDLYVQGLGTKEILKQKGIRESTLRYHNRNLYGKLGLSSRKQLLLYADLTRQVAAKPEENAD